MTTDVELLERFGAPFLGYLCAMEEPEIQARLLIGSALELPRIDAVERVRELAMTATPVPEGWSPDRDRALALVAPTHPDGRTEADNLRAAAGGDIWEPQHSDPVVGALLQIAATTYPLLLVPPGSPFWPMRWKLPTQIYLDKAIDELPAHSKFLEAVAADEVNALFPALDPVNGACGYLTASIGRQATLLRTKLAAALIEWAWVRARLRGSVPGPVEIGAELDSVVADARRLARGEEIKVDGRIGMVGFAVDSHAAIATLAGTLRAARPTDAWLVPEDLLDLSNRHRPPEFGPPSFLQAFTNPPDFVDFNDAERFSSAVLLEAEVSYSILISADPASVEVQVVDLERAALNGLIESVQLAGLLAVDDHTRIVVSPSWWFLHQPMLNVRMAWDERRGGVPFAPALLEPQARTFRDWIDRIARQRRDEIAIALRRTIAAFAERDEPRDRIIDAVVAWENLFGPSDSPTMATSAALAWLLKPDDKGARAELFAQTKRLYGLRSRLVHGSHVTDPKVNEAVEDVLSLTQRVLRALFRDRPDLIADPRRGERLLLGG